jgi:type III secretion protein O
MPVLKDLLLIRRAREARAMRVVADLSTQRDRAEMSVEQAVVRLDSGRLHAHEAETALYRDLCGHVVSLRDIGRIRDQVGKLRGGTAALTQSLTDARQRLQGVQDELGTARERRKFANRETDKTTEFSRVHAVQDALDNERKMEEDLDEAAAMSRGNATP